MGYPPDQVWMVGGTQDTAWDGVPPPEMGYPQPEMGYPLTRSGWWGGTQGTSYLRWGTPLTQTWDGVPPTWDAPLPHITQSSIASTCYAAGGVPLAFTQEDFLVKHWIIRSSLSGLHIYLRKEYAELLLCHGILNITNTNLFCKFPFLSRLIWRSKDKRTKIACLCTNMSICQYPCE